MGLFKGGLKGALKASILMKALEIARREAGKPENQRKAKEIVAKLMDRIGRGTRRS